MLTVTLCELFFWEEAMRPTTSHLTRSISPSSALSFSGECMCVCVSYSWLAADKDSLQSPQITERKKLQSEFVQKRSKLQPFVKTVVFLRISVYSSAEQQFSLVTFCLSYWREQESLCPQLQVHNTAVGNTSILGAGKTSEFFLSPVESDRKKEVTVCGDGWSGNLQVIG